MKQVRYINLDKVPPEIFSSMWEVDLVIDITEPTIIRWTADRLLCHFWHGPFNITGPREDRDVSKDVDGSLWKYREVDISPILTSPELSHIHLMRCYEPIEISYSSIRKRYGLGEEYNHVIEDAEIAYYIEDQDVSNWVVLHPDKKKRGEIDALMHTTLEDILLEYKVKTRIIGNDILFQHPMDNKWKKFVGTLFRPAEKGYGYSDFAITWKFNPTETNKIRSVAKKENIEIKKFEVEDIAERVGGILEADSTLDRDEIERKFLNRVCKSLEFTIKEDNLLPEEREKLFVRGRKRFEDKEWQYTGNNSNFTKRQWKA